MKTMERKRSWGKFSRGYNPFPLEPDELVPADLPEEIDCTEDELTASICQDSFFEFLKEFWNVVSEDTPHWNWHIPLMCDEAQVLAERVMKGLPKLHDEVVNIPPGTTKSIVWSVMYCPWVWTRMPKARFICLSYSHPLALNLSRLSRQIVKSEKYQRLFPHVELSDDQDTKGFFTNKRGGYRYSSSVGGTVTGYHGHFIVVDDPLDPNQAASELDLQAVNRWMKDTLPTRKTDKAVTPTALIMQRLGEDDPSAQMLEKNKKREGRVRHVCLPSELTEDVQPPSLAANYVDGLLDPVRLSRDVLNDYMEDGEFMYSAQFLQRPKPPGGSMFKVNRIKEATVPPWKEFIRLVRFWDKAGTAWLKGKKNHSAFTVGTLMGMKLDDVGHKTFWVLDVIRGRWDSGDRERTIRETAEMDGFGVIIGIEEEPGSGGKQSAEESVANLAGFRVRTVKVSKAEGDKEQRADAFSVQVNHGRVYVPTDADWLEPWLSELEYFPNSKYKDQVDSASCAFTMLRGKVKRVGGMKDRLLKQTRGMVAARN